jgi:sulfite reductase (ferredoxin)
VPAEDVVQAAEAVIKIFRDHGNRENRKRARIKYVVHDWGAEKFRDVMSEYMGRPLPLPKEVEVQDFDLHLGWHAQGDGKYWYGIHIENGRIKDEGPLRLRTALRQIIEQYKPAIRNTPMQDILLCNLDESARAGIEKILREHGVIAPYELSLVQTHSMSCPAIPTCGLAISESERVLPDLIDELETATRQLGLEGEKLTVRMTGCPNGCVRPYQSDIGLVGRSGDKYSVFVGGHILGHRLNFMIQDLVPLKEIVPMLTPLLRHYKEQRQNGETFGDYCHRLGAEKLHLLIPENLRRPLPQEATECEGEE